WPARRSPVWIVQAVRAAPPPRSESLMCRTFIRIRPNYDSSADGRPSAHARPLRPPPQRARRCAGEPLVPDPRARPGAVRGAHLLPARPRRGALQPGGREGAHRPRRRLHAHLGLDLPRPPLAPLPPRARAAAAPRAALPADAAPAPLRATPLERLAFDLRGLARAPRVAAGRVAPAPGASGRPP